ncbi:MAG TPA: 4-hydroxy-3-methylbut-2-enyl diphosphate reductase, partial [Spirillospora sp.]|nr:4-hydroxy-3-methylbut-2-enyl diphosphate reductase [Spirillospora sp.]
PERARKAAARLGDAGALAVAGFGGALDERLRPGDLFVATEIRGTGPPIPCPTAEPLAGLLERTTGATVHRGPLVTADHIVTGRERAELAATGAMAADMESAPLAAAAGERPVAVVRAIVERALEMHGPPVYVRKQIVHNTHVVNDLARRGAVFVDELDEVPPGAVTVFSAHGVAPAVRDEAGRLGLRVIDATCPLVAKVHAEARRYAARGDLVALIGHAGHEEVEGTLGEAPHSTVLVQTPADVAALPADRPVAYLTQTTLSADEAGEVAAAITRRFPDARGPHTDDICYATTNRQRAVTRIARDADLVLVVGSANSSNSRRLVEVAEQAGAPAVLIDGPADIPLGRLRGARAVGVTAGASAPPAVLAAVVAALRGLGPADLVEREVTVETTEFTLPKEVRP